MRLLWKIKYPLFGVVGLVLLRNAFKGFATPFRIRAAMNLFLISITVASIYGVIKAWGEFNLLTFATGAFEDRNGGLTGVMRYSYGIQMVLIVLSGLLVYRKQVPDFFNRGLFFTAYATSLIGLWASGSRGAFVGFLCAFPFIFFFANRWRFWISGVPCWTLAGLILFGNYTSNTGVRILNHQPSASSALRGMQGDDRLSLYQAALLALKERPALGYGPGQFRAQIIRLREQYDLSWKGRSASHAHNVFLETAANLGSVGLVVLLGWLYFWARELWARKDLMAKCILPFICAFIVSGQFEYTFDANNAFLIFFIYSISSIASPTEPKLATHHAGR